MKCVHNIEVHCMFTFRFIQLSYFAIKDTLEILYVFQKLVAIASVGQWFSQEVWKHPMSPYVDNLCRQYKRLKLFLH